MLYYNLKNFLETIILKKNSRHPWLHGEFEGILEGTKHCQGERETGRRVRKEEKWVGGQLQKLDPSLGSHERDGSEIQV